MTISVEGRLDALPADLQELMREMAERLNFLDSRFVFCYGTPEGAVVGSRGQLALRLDGGATTVLYVKTSGDGTNTGWTAK